MTNLAYMHNINISKTNNDTMNNVIKFPFGKNNNTETINPIQTMQITNNHIFNYDPVKEEYEVFPFKSKDDVQKLSIYFASVKNSMYKWRNLLIFSLGCNIGLRAGDLLSLKWGMVIQNNKIVDSVVIYEEKTKKKRKFHLNNDCKEAIKLYLENTYQKISTVDKDSYIFTSRKGNEFLSVRSYGKILKTAATNVDIEYNVGTHSMRKTFGYNVYKITNNIELVQKMFGHSSSAVTLRYIGIDD
jgi:site-specific recombinase XerD